MGKAGLESQASNTSNQNSPCPLPASRPHPFVLFPPWQREPHQTPLFKLKTLEIFSPNSSSSLISELTLVSLTPLPLSQLNSVTISCLVSKLALNLPSSTLCAAARGFSPALTSSLARYGLQDNVQVLEVFHILPSPPPAMQGLVLIPQMRSSMALAHSVLRLGSLTCLPTHPQLKFLLLPERVSDPQAQ